MEYKSNIPTHNLKNPGFDIISKVINPVTFTICLKEKNYLLSPNHGPFTRYPNILMLMSHYITKEQNLLANLQ